MSKGGRPTTWKTAGKPRSLAFPPEVWQAIDDERKAGESRSGCVARLLSLVSHKVRHALHGRPGE